MYRNVLRTVRIVSHMYLVSTFTKSIESNLTYLSHRQSFAFAKSFETIRQSFRQSFAKFMKNNHE